MIKKHRFHISASIILSLACLTGCIPGKKANSNLLAMPPGGAPQPVMPANYPEPQSQEGSLWAGKRASMFEDTKANYVGDTLIVDIMENSRSKLDVNSEASRSSKMGVGVPTFNMLGFKTNLGGGKDPNLIKTDFSNEFEGTGKSDRSGQITASVAARVVEILPNGNLSIFGHRSLKVDNEVQHILVSGVVRPQDISAANRVQSTYLADANIEYYGKGALSEKQRPGWGSRLIDKIWPW